MRIYAPSWNSKSLAQVSRVSPISLCIAVLQLVWFPRFPYGSRDRAPSVPRCEGLDACSCNPLSTEWKSEQGGDVTDRKGWRRTECREKEQKLRATVLKTWKYALKYTRKKGGRGKSPSPHRPTGWRDKSSQSSPSLSFPLFLFLTSHPFSRLTPSTTRLSFLKRTRGRFKTTSTLKILRLLFNNPDLTFVPHKSRGMHVNLIYNNGNKILYIQYICLYIQYIFL